MQTEAITWDGNNHRPMWDFLTDLVDSPMDSSSCSFYLDFNIVQGGLVLRQIPADIPVNLGDTVLRTKNSKDMSWFYSLISAGTPYFSISAVDTSTNEKHNTKGVDFEKTLLAVTDQFEDLTVEYDEDTIIKVYGNRYTVRVKQENRF